MSEATAKSTSSPLRFMLGLSTGLAGLLLLCELLLRLLPVSSATFVDRYLDPQLLSYPPHFDWISSTGWDLRNAQHNRTNNAGFVGRRDLQRDSQGIALIGDSIVESSMLPPEHRPAEQLEHAAGGAKVYALGMPGSALLDYAERMRWAQEAYGLRRFVLLLETGDLRQSLCGSGNVHGPCLDPKTLALASEAKPAPSLLKRVLRHSALARYLTGQLKLDAGRLWRQALLQARAPVDAGAAQPRTPQATSNSGPQAPSAASLTVTRAFLDRIAALDIEDLVIVLDAKRSAIYAGQSHRDADLEAFSQAMRAAGASMVDGAPLFEAHYRQHGLSFDVGPYDGHLNPLGVQLLMEAAGQAIARQRKTTSG
jgi:hypothetical protein